MAKYLLLLLLISPISHAQYCTYSLTPKGYITNLQCFGIDQNVALRLHWCPARPQDPVCPPLVSCTYSALTEQRSCPPNYDGFTTWKQETNCPSGAWGSPSNSGWFQIASSCTPKPPSCQITTDSRTETCGANQSGQKIYTRTNICPDPYSQPVQGSWTLTSNTCTFNPPSCNPTSQTQTLACQQGYVGAVMQTRTSMCPDPYGQPVWSPWVTTSDSCVKSPTNPTNMSSALNPVSPISPMSAITTPTGTATVQNAAQSNNSTNQTSMDGSSVPSTASSALSQTAQPSATSDSTANLPKGKIFIPGLGLALSTELISKTMPPQANLFPDQQIGQEIPNDYKYQMHDLYGVNDSPKFDKLTQDTVELEQ